MSVQLTVTGTQDSTVGTVRLTVSDPNNEVRAVEFITTDSAGAQSRALSADRNPSAGVYEKDVPLLARSFIRVQPQVRLANESILKSVPALFGSRGEPRNVAPGVLASQTVTPSSRKLTVAAPLGSAVEVLTFARRGAWPTIDGAEFGEPSDAYLRFIGGTAGTTFSMAADPGAWHVISLGYNAAGQAGPRKTSITQVPQ